MRPPPSTPSSMPRWHLLDSLRGLALLGILLVNSLDITGVGQAAGPATGDDPVRSALYLAVQTRFVPIFAFLFGMSLWFVLDGAQRRAARPVLVVIRRLAILIGTGWLLALVYPGNILIEYGIYGAAALAVVALVPRRIVLVLGIAATAVSYAVFGGGEPTTPGLILAGAGAAATGLPRAIEAGGRRVVIVLLVAGAAAAPLLMLQLRAPGDPRFTIGATAGVVLAVAYTAGFALLWRTRARGALAAVLDPLGRMALSNYVGAAVVFAALSTVVDFAAMTSVWPTVVLALAVIAVQSVLSRMWLSRFRYGPLEWVWRTGTWWRRVPLRRVVAPAPGPEGRTRRLTASDGPSR